MLSVNSNDFNCIYIVHTDLHPLDIKNFFLKRLREITAEKKLIVQHKNLIDKNFHKILNIFKVINSLKTKQQDIETNVCITIKRRGFVINETRLQVDENKNITGQLQNKLIFLKANSSRVIFSSC